MLTAYNCLRSAISVCQKAFHSDASPFVSTIADGSDRCHIDRVPESVTVQMFSLLLGEGIGGGSNNPGRHQRRRNSA